MNWLLLAQQTAVCSAGTKGTGLWPLSCYLQGYACGDPKKRGNPIYFAGMLGMLGLLGTTIKVAVDLIGSK